MQPKITSRSTVARLPRGPQHETKTLYAVGASLAYCEFGIQAFIFIFIFTFTDIQKKKKKKQQSRTTDGPEQSLHKRSRASLPMSSLFRRLL